MAVIPWPLRPVPHGVPPAVEATAASAWTLMRTRRTVLPKRLVAPGPSAAELSAILDAAAHAPDHGQLLPWRFVLVPEAARAALAEVFAQALAERDATATPEQLALAREKAYRAPVLLLAVVDAGRGDPRIDVAERLVSTGCALQNMLLMATAQGYGSALTSGRALKAAGLRALFRLGAQEQALCFLSIGTVQARKAAARARPATASYVSTLGADGVVLPFESAEKRV